VAPDSAKASFLDLVKSIASDIAYEAYDQLESRLAKVESQPLPSKGIGASIPQEQFQPLSSVQKSAMEAEVTKSLSAMNDDQRTKLAAGYFAADWRGVLPTPTH
jgi:hypothetical protein